ncbi:DUF2625 family protein [Corynebacterium sp. CCUG 59401]|nr:DUF2625 family protein [Corynebacterium pseudogenitalium]
MGAVALHTGGIVVDHGWVRLYGGGSEHLRASPKPTGWEVPFQRRPASSSSATMF